MNKENLDGNEIKTYKYNKTLSINHVNQFVAWACIKSCFDTALFLYKKQIYIKFYKKILNLLKFVYIIIKNEK